jgi:hypothetical protein
LPSLSSLSPGTTSCCCGSPLYCVPFKSL